MKTTYTKAIFTLILLFSFLSLSTQPVRAAIGPDQAGCHWSGGSCNLVNRCTGGKVPVSHLNSIYCAAHSNAITCALVTDKDCVAPLPPTSNNFQSLNPATNIDPNGTISDILSNKTGTSFSIINLLIFIAGLAFFVNLVIAGWNYIFSAGDPKKAAAASSRLLNGFIGLVIVLASFLIVRLVSSVIGFKLDPLI